MAWGVGSIRIPDDYVVFKTKRTSYEKVAWNLELIDREPGKIRGSVLFFGPSLMQGGVSDSLLQASGIPAINLGTNGPGDEVELYFINRVVGLKPQKIYMHVYKGPHRDLHNMTPLLYKPGELLASGQSINAPFAKFLFDRASYALNYVYWEVFRPADRSEPVKKYGVRYEEGGIGRETYEAIRAGDMQDFIESFKLQRNGFVKESEAQRSGFYFKLIRARRRLMYQVSNFNFISNTASQERFEQSAIAACNQHKIPVEGLYLPVVADAIAQQLFDSTAYGKPALHVTSVPGASFLNNYAYWSDMTHLSREGSLVFTNALLSDHIIKTAKIE